jgi:ABC-type branched-chain amino acid transport systems, ATPase component
MLRVTDLQVHYGKIHAVRKTTFSVARGEIVSVVGANGAGKSTIMWTLAGVLKPTSGKSSSTAGPSPGSPTRSSGAAWPWCPSGDASLPT